MLISGYARYDKKGCTMLYVVKMGWQEPGHPERVDGVLRYALRGVAHTVIDSLEPFVSLCTRRSGGEDLRFLFAVNLARGGLNMAYARMISFLSQHVHCLEGCCGAVVVDGADELFTKKIGREMIFMANWAGCAFPGKPLVEATGSLYNFTIQARVRGVDNLEAYEEGVRQLVQKLISFAPPPERGRHVLALHASSRRTSNTLLLWEMVRRHLTASRVEEISLRNGTVVDCRGCSYEACLHFGERGDCFYGGIMVEQVYPAVRQCDTLVLICPNYNDAVGANIMAFFNRLTALFRTDWQTFSKKRVFALVVSGYSGGDIVAEQIIGALNCNKNFILPGHFALMETANEPKSILRCPGIEERAELLARHIDIK